MRIADALDDRQRALVIERLQARELRVQADVIVDLQHRVALEGKAGTRGVVGVVRPWNDGIEAVIAAGELHDNEDALVGIALIRGDRTGE